MTTIDIISLRILHHLFLDFREQNLAVKALTKGYVGMQLGQLRDSCTDSDHALDVDFDVALKDLEGRKLVNTGPEQYHDGTSTIVFHTRCNKREYAYLSFAGYIAAQEGEKKSAKQPSMETHINISDSHFHQSPIGVGREVTQSTSINIQNDPEAVEKLAEILSSHLGDKVSDETRNKLGTLVATAHQGDIPAAKSMFQEIFGAAKETVKQAAWGILTAILTKQIGL